MLVNAATGRTLKIDTQKVARGQFFTTHDAWLAEPIREFLSFAFLDQAGAGHARSVLDPFAGDGHLLQTVAEQFGVETHGLDIANPKFKRNDSLRRIPNKAHSVIVTNPPYLANHSAKRKGVSKLVASYFEISPRDNLYKIALDRCLAEADYVVAIIPETFLLSNYPKDRLALALVIEGDLFADTSAPAVVACFGPNHVLGAGNVYVANRHIGTLDSILALRGDGGRAGKPATFNVPDGRIGLRAVDQSDDKTFIEFMAAKDFDYNPSSIKVSSRLLTYLEVPGLADADIDRVVLAANAELARIREASADLVLAPFKGNTKLGRRRRRLDFELAREIISRALQTL